MQKEEERQLYFVLDLLEELRLDYDNPLYGNLQKQINQELEKDRELEKLNKMLELSWQIKDFDNRGYGYDLVSQVALSVNMAVQDVKDAQRIQNLAWILHTRIVDTDYVDLPNISVEALYSKLRGELNNFLTEGGLL